MMETFVTGIDDPAPTTFAERMRPAALHEAAATTELRAAGWTVGQFGQAMLTKEVRDALRKTDSDLRWLPDLIATRLRHECLVDAKTTLSQTTNHSIELRAHRAHLSMTYAYGTPVIYYFGDGSATVASDLVIECLMDGRYTRGSGTPFLLTKKDVQTSFTDVLGADATIDWGRDWRREGRQALASLNEAITVKFGSDLPEDFWRSKP